MITKSELVHKYPKLFDFVGIVGINCGDGWNDLIDKMSAKIVAILPEAEVARLISLDGTLCVDMYVGNAEVYDILDWYERKSRHVCEVCGDYGNMWVDKGAWKVRCESCKAKELS
jgi:hypothetical protein